MKKQFAVVLFAVAGCGSDSGKATVDAPGHTIDSGPTIDAPPPTGVATVTIHGLLASDAGISVSFADPSGHATTVAITDSTGKASATIAPHSSATAVIVGSSTGATILTALDLQPGDNVVVAVPPPVPAPPAIGSAKVTLPAAFAGATSYAISVGCTTATGAAASQVTLAMNESCKNASGKYDIAALALDANSKPLAYSNLFDQTAPAANTSSTVTLPAWQSNVAPLTFQFTNGAPALTTLSVGFNYGRGALSFGSQSAAPTLASGAASAGFVVPQGAFDHFGFQISTGNGTTTQGLLIRAASMAFPNPTAINLATDMLPFIDDLELFYQVGHTMPTFQIAGDTSGTSGLVAVTNYTTATGTVQLIVEIPAGSTDIDLPELPDALSAYRPARPFAPSGSEVLVLKGGPWTDAKSFRETFGLLLTDENAVVNPAPGKEFAASIFHP